MVRRTAASWHRAVQAPGYTGRLDLGFLRWVWRSRTDSRPTLDAAIDASPASSEGIELDFPRAVERWVATLGR